MRILVVGGQGFIGQALVARLRGGAGYTKPVSLADHGTRSAHRRSHRRCAPALRRGRYQRASALERSIEGGVDCVFHLASMPGGAAERDFELGMRVNLHSTLALLEALRLAGGMPTLVFASSIGVYGVPMPGVIDEQTIPLPTLSYGSQKLIGEYLVADYGRRGLVDGRSVRIPGIVARPPSKGMLSLFLSDLIRELSAGREFVCPVAPEGMSWFMSRPLHRGQPDPRRAARRPAGRRAAHLAAASAACIDRIGGGGDRAAARQRGAASRELSPRPSAAGAIRQLSAAAVPDARRPPAFAMMAAWTSW